MFQYSYQLLLSLLLRIFLGSEQSKITGSCDYIVVVGDETERVMR